MPTLQHVHVSTRAEWRRWLRKHHNREESGIWLVFDKQRTKKPVLVYEEALEEALCFGWIDSVIRRIDASTYCRKFTPRRQNSVWSPNNRSRVEKLIREQRMTPAGLAKIATAKSSGRWEGDRRTVIRMEMAPELVEALARNPAARAFFEKLAPSDQKLFIGWIGTARRPETRAKRLETSLAMLARGEKLGPK